MSEPTGAGTAAKPATTPRQTTHEITLNYGPPFVALPGVARVRPGDKLLFIRLTGDPEHSIRITFDDPEPFSVAVFEHKGLDVPEKAVDVQRPLKGFVHYRCDLLGPDGEVIAGGVLERGGVPVGGGLEPDTGDRRVD